MKKLLLSLLLVLAIPGCQIDPEIKKATAGYTEAEHKGRIYVLASPESAENFAKGMEPQLTITKIGYGPGKKTVIFEVDKAGNEYWRIQEFNRRHGKPSDILW